MKTDTALFFIIFSLLFVSTKVYAYRNFELNEDLRVVLALENEDVTIVCKTEMPMAYCGFVHPSGKRYSFSGPSLENGLCNLRVKVTMKDSGEWRCHIGKRSIGEEVSQRIVIRVVDQVAAQSPRVTAVHGKEITLSCVTTKEKIPLRYCRFEPPNGTPFSINSAVKPSQPILGKYYYPQNLSLDRGDCAVTIRKVKYTDVGDWTCGVGLDDGKEYTDVIKLHVEGLYAMSTASTTGVAFGAVAIVVFLTILGFVTWKKRRLLGTSDQTPETIDIQELRVRPGTPTSQRSRTPPMERAMPSVVVHSPSDPDTSSRLM